MRIFSPPQNQSASPLIMALQIAKSVALPGQTPPLRLPSFPALERTAVMSFNAAKSLTVGANETRCMLARQAYYPFWFDYTFPLGQPMAYGLAWSTGLVSGFGALHTASQRIVGNHLGRTFANTPLNGYTTPAITGASPTAPWESYPIIGVDSTTGPQEWLYVPANTWLFMSVTRQTTSTSLDCIITFEQWQKPGDTAEFVSTGTSVVIGSNAGGANTPFQPTTNIWIRPVSINLASSADAVAHDFSVYVGVSFGTLAPSYTPAVGNAGSWAINGGPMLQKVFLPVAVSPEFDNSILPWAATRCTAVSALMTNTTKVLNKEGTVLWGRLNPQVHDVWNSFATTLTSIHPAEKAFLDLEQGTYTYCPPSTDLADFRCHYIQPEPSYAATFTANNCPVYRLDNTAMVNFGSFNDPDGQTSLALNLDWHVEFRTSSTLFQIGVSNLTLEALHGAQIALLKAGFFYHNFNHVAVLNGIIKAVGSLNPILRVMAPLARGLLGSSSVALSSRPGRNSRPAPTSGAKSGIVGPGRKASRKRRPPRLPPFTRARTTRTRSEVNRANSAMNRMMARQGRPAPGAR
jgi:hypothetical protein